MSVLADLLERGSAHLRKAGIENSRLEARLLLAHALGLSQEEMLGGQGVPNPQAMSRFESLLRRRSEREPLAYIVGWREFWSLPFEVGPGVLVPRPDSETLIEAALTVFPEHDAELDVLDLGTGSGCLLLSFLHERPQAHGIGVDISEDALGFAASNAFALELSERSGFQVGNWLADLRGQFDVILANPPYIADGEIDGLDPEVAHYEPRSALAGGLDGLDAYRGLADILPRLLRLQGYAFVELGMGQEPDVTKIFTGAGLRILRIVPDLAGIPRCLVVGLGNPP